MVTTRLKTMTAAICLVVASFQTTSAVVMAPGSDPQDYRNYGATFADQKEVAAFKILADGINPEGLASATPINSHFLITNAHVVTGVLANRSYQVLLGSNINTPVITLEVASVLIYPGYDGTRNTPDVAIIQLSTPYLGFHQATFGSSNPGDIISSAGYGFAMRPEDPIPAAQDGNAYGWNSWVYDQAPNASSDLLYNRTLFSSALNTPLDGKLLGGDSGSPTWSASGVLVGLNTAQSGGTNILGGSVYLDMSPSLEHTNWIVANSVIPEPNAAALIGIGFGVAALGHRRRVRSQN